MKYFIEAILLIAISYYILKWMFIITTSISAGLYALYEMDKNKYKVVITLPYRALRKICRGGELRFAIYEIGTIPSHHVRKYFYKLMGANIGKNAVFHLKTKIRDPWRLQVGKGVQVGDNAELDARSGLTIGDNVNLSSNVNIWTLQHDHRKPDFGCYTSKDRKLSVEIGDRAWIGSNVIILPGVSIGEGSVCCAGCVVTKDVAPFTIVAGVPAKKIGVRLQNLTYVFDDKAPRFY